MDKQEISHPVPVHVECEEELIDLVRELTGIRIHDHQLKKFRQTIVQACQVFNFNNCREYIDALQDSSLNSSIQEHLIAGITIGESYFFRDRTQMDFLTNSILPNLIQQRRDQGSLYLRIWSAGCSDGQELYSIMILLNQLLPDIDKWNLHLLGTDINVASLSRAIKGSYSEWSMRSTSDDIRKKFFIKSGTQWQINKPLQLLSKFSYLNLYGDKFPSILSETHAMDLILCRNVFIYFDQATASSVMHKFYQSLSPGGYLLQGASDLLDHCNIKGFEQHVIENTSYYVRTDTVQESDSIQYGLIAEDRFKEKIVSSIVPPEQIDQKITTSREQNLATETTIISSTTPIKVAVKSYKTIIQMLTDEAWNDALDNINMRINKGDDNAIIWQFKAKALANLGRIREALKACDLSIEHDPEDKHTYFIQALVFMEGRRLDKSEEALRRTLYLDRNFVEAHYHMGLLRMLQGKRESGIKYMKNALEISEQADPNRSLHDAAGMNHARMATILRSELRMYQEAHN